MKEMIFGSICCEYCGEPIPDGYRICPSCGKKVGGSLFVLLFGIVFGIIGPFACYIGVKTGAFLGGGGDPIKVLVMWELPILTMTAVLYDHNRIRSRLYFLIGGILTILAVIWANN